MNIFRKHLQDLVRGLFGTKRLLDNSKDLSVNTALYYYEIRRFQLIDKILYCQESGVNSEKYVNHDIIVSLTTYGKRINDVAFTIESIMQQSMKANRIILWLDNSFKDKVLPSSLLRQQKRGLEIAFCTDVRSYTKLVPALCNYPDAAIITIDDDVFYDYDLLETLIRPYLEAPQFIYCHRYHKMKLDAKGILLPYKQWEWRCHDDQPSHFNFATGVGGVLYPPRSLDDEVLNQSVFMDICKYADDVWFKAMAIKKGTLVKRVPSRNDKCEDYIMNEGVQDIGLCNINDHGDMLNDRQIKAVFTKYNLYNKLIP